MTRNKIFDIKQFILSVFFSLLLVIGYSYEKEPDILLLRNLLMHPVLYLILFLLLLVLLYTLIRLLFCLFDKIQPADTSGDYDLKRDLPIFFGIVLAFRIPFLILNFPCTSMGFDYFWQLLQGIGAFPLSNHHPVLGSLFYGLLYKIGYTFGGASGGLFFTALFQTLLSSFAIGLSVVYLKSYGVSRKILLIVLGFYCINPIYSTYSLWLIKDSLYSSVATIIFALTMDFIFRFDVAGLKKLMVKSIILGICCFILTQIRNDGLIVVAMLIISLLAFSLISGFKSHIKPIVVIIMCFFVLFGTTKIIVKQNNICPTNVRESLAIVNSCVMDYIQKYESEVTDSEWATLEEIYGKDREQILVMAKDHKFLVADNIKTAFLESDQTKDYLAMWFKVGIRHPGTYVDAILRSTRGYWYPPYDPDTAYHALPGGSPEEDFANEQTRNYCIMQGREFLVSSFEFYNIDIDNDTTIGQYVSGNKMAEDLFSVKTPLYDQKQDAIGFANMVRNAPILAFFFVPGTYLFIGAFLFLYLLCSRKKGLYLLPILIVVPIACLSPVNGYMRYVLPLVMLCPFVMGLCFINESKKS